MCSIELGRIDILMEVSCLSQHLCSPIEVQLHAVHGIFCYLQKNLGNNTGGMTYKPIYEPTDYNVFEVVGRYLDEWKDFYRDYQEIMPSHMPEALGKYSVIKSYVDANHAVNMESWRSHSIIIIYVNNSPIIWYSKF